MNIELKQAAQQVLDAFEAFGEADDFATLFTLTQKMNALRTAIQQAAESEPVAWVSKTGHGTYFRESITPELVSLEHGGRKMWRPLTYANNHTAPGVPDDVARDAERYRWLRDRDHWPAPFASSQDPEPVRGIDLDAAIDAAMFAAKDTK